MKNNSILNTKLNSNLLAGFAAEDLFCAEAFCGDENISDFLVKKLYSIFDNLPINKKMAIIFDLLVQQTYADSFEYNVSALENLVFDAENATEQHFTQNFDKYKHATNFCEDFDVVITLKYF